MCLVFGFITNPFEKTAEEEITVSYSDKSKDSIAAGIRAAYARGFLVENGNFCMKLGFMVACGRYCCMNFFL